MSAAFASLLATYVALQAARIAASLRFLLAASPPGPGAGPTAEERVTVLQPILSGDPALGECLRRNQDASPGARFLLLVDDDDAAAQRLAAPLASARTRVVAGPPPRDGENPKAAKLARALPLVGTPLLAVLDDDTVLPPGALARAASLAGPGRIVTALPCYVAVGSLWSRLVAAFVNGSSLITYPAAAATGHLRTINGMFYVVDAEDLRARGGFAAIRGELTDDYAMAQLFSRDGAIVQSALVHPVRTTVEGPLHYLSLMRRWMIFAGRYGWENPSPFLLLCIGAPTVLPPALLGLALAAGPGALAWLGATLLGKAALTAWMRRRFGGRATGPSELLLEPVADLLTPVHMVLAAVAPGRLRWRTRRMRVGGRGITYE